MIGDLVEADASPPLAWGCLLCRTVVAVGGGDRFIRPAHECRFGGEMEPLLPLGIVVDLMKASREAP